MTEYICESCNIKVKLIRWLSEDDFTGATVPTADECPNCGEDDPEKFRYL